MRRYANTTMRVTKVSSGEFLIELSAPEAPEVYSVMTFDDAKFMLTKVLCDHDPSLDVESNEWFCSAVITALNMSPHMQSLEFEPC